MSFIYRDFLSPEVATTAACGKLFHRFDKLWSKSNGWYNNRYYFYYGGSYQRTEKLERFLKMFNITWEEFTKEKPDKDIESIWFEFKDEYNWDGSYALNDDGLDDQRAHYIGGIPSAEDIASYFNEAFRVPDPPLPPYPERNPDETDEEYQERVDEWEEKKKNRLIDQEIEVTIKYGTNGTYINKHEQQWWLQDDGTIGSQPVDTQSIKEAIESDPWLYCANSYEMAVSVDDSYAFQEYDGGDVDYGDSAQNEIWNKPTYRAPMTSVTANIIDKEPRRREPPSIHQDLAVFVLMDDGGMFECVNESYNERPTTVDRGVNDGQQLNYQYSKKYKFRGATTHSKIVLEIIKYYERTKRSRKMNERRSKTLKKALVNYNGVEIQDDSVYKRVLSKMYHRGQNGSVAMWNSNMQLNSEVARLMKRRDFAEMIGNCLTTDYAVKKAKWWEKVLAVVIVIVAIVAAIFVGPGSLVALGSLHAGEVALMLGTAASVLSIGAAILSYFGGLSANKLVKLIGKVATIVGVAATVAGVYAFLNNASRWALKQAASEAGEKLTESALEQRVAALTLADKLSYAVDFAVDSIKTKLTEFVSMSFVDKVDFIMDSLDVINKGLSFHQDSELKELQKEYRELKEQEDEYNKEVLGNALKNPAEVWVMTEDRIMSYDALQELQIKINAVTGSDENHQTWNTNVNSV